MACNKQPGQNLHKAPKPVVRLCFHHGPWDGAELNASQQAAVTLCQARRVFVSMDALPIGVDNETVWTPTTSLVTISKSTGTYQEQYRLVAIEARVLHFLWAPQP